MPFGYTDGDIESTFSGWSIALEGDIGAGPSAGFEASCGVDENGLTTLGSNKSPVKGGGGAGFWIGLSFCYSTIYFCGDIGDIMEFIDNK